MKFLNRNARRLVLAVSLSWITFHMYWLPFHPWTLGMVRPWFMLQGLIPYRDFVWIRMPADLFVLAGWYSLFGVSPDSYRALITAIVLTTMIILWKRSSLSVVLFAILFPPLFFNTEIGEMLIGLYATMFAYVFHLFLIQKNRTALGIAGVLAGLMVMTKQSTATVSLAVAFTIVLGGKYLNMTALQKAKQFLLYLSGASIVPIVILIYFTYHHALTDLYYYTVEFLLTSYVDAPVNKGTGLLLTGSLLVLGLPMIVRGVNSASMIHRLFFFTLLLCLTPLLYPSFLSYRAYPLLPVIAFAAPLIYDEWRVRAQKTYIILLCASLFLYGTMTYMKEYYAFITDNGFHLNQWLYDYGDVEFETANWVREQTNRDDRIMVYANSMIYVLSDRLPANKYVDPFPYLLEPMDKTASVFFDNLPRVFIYDRTLPEVHVGLDSFPFIQALEQYYTQEKTIGTMELYTLQTGQSQE